MTFPEGTPPPDPAADFVAPSSPPIVESQEDAEAAERTAFAEEVNKRIQRVYGAVGLEGMGEDYRKQTLPNGLRERRFVSRHTVTGAVDYLLAKPDGGIVSGSFSLGLDVSKHDDALKSASAAYHFDDGSAEGREALVLIDGVINDIFPDTVKTATGQTPPTEA